MIHYKENYKLTDQDKKLLEDFSYLQKPTFDTQVAVINVMEIIRKSTVLAVNTIIAKQMGLKPILPTKQIYFPFTVAK